MTADHLDPPLGTDPAEDSTPDRAADIADAYPWAAGGNLNVAVTFAGPAPVSQAGTYDREVLYLVFISNDGNALNTENAVRVRFGPGRGNTFGAQATGIPGAGTLTIIPGLPRCPISSVSSRTMRRPEIEVSGTAARHSLVSSSTTLSTRNRCPDTI